MLTNSILQAGMAELPAATVSHKSGFAGRVIFFRHYFHIKREIFTFVKEKTHNGNTNLLSAIICTMSAAGECLAIRSFDRRRVRNRMTADPATAAAFRSQTCRWCGHRRKDAAYSRKATRYRPTEKRPLPYGNTFFGLSPAAELPADRTGGTEPEYTAECVAAAISTVSVFF